MSAASADGVFLSAGVADPESQPAMHDLSLALVCWTEPLDVGGSGRLLERARPLCAACRVLIVDLSGTPYFDSSGARALLVLGEQLEAAGKQLRLVVKPGSSVERVLTLLQLSRRFETCTSLEEAGMGLRESGSTRADAGEPDGTIRCDLAHTCGSGEAGVRETLS